MEKISFWIIVLLLIFVLVSPLKISAQESVEDCGGVGVVKEKGVRNDYECWQKTSQLGEFPFDEQREKRSPGEGLLDLICPAITKLPFFEDEMSNIVCRTGYLSKDLRSIQLPADRAESEDVLETEDVEGELSKETTRVKSMDEDEDKDLDLTKLWGFIGRNTSDSKTGFLTRHLPRSVNESLEGISSDKERTIEMHNNLRQAWTPRVLGRKTDVEPEPGGDGSGEEPVVGSCDVLKTGPCDWQKLLAYFGNDEIKAKNASMVCNAESGGNPELVNLGCRAGKSVDYSIGLFQINMLAHCPGAFSNYSFEPPSCTIGNEVKLEICSQNFFAPEKNILKAVELSENGEVWSRDWKKAAKLCGLQ